ncbi:MAG TPA: sialidase family protein [Vicinamibacterales bacterium]|nr:sialidase family protein [Vicinamibacterales bacterium]
MELLRKALLIVALAGMTVGARDATTTLEVRGRVNEHVSLASDGQFVVAAWAASQSEGGTEVYAAASRDGGQSFAQPVRVSDSGSRADVGGEQPPQVAIAAQPGGARGVIVLWGSKGAAGTRLISARSADGGRTFGRPALVAGSGAPGNRGWEAMTTDARGRALALWLDHRDTARQGSAGRSASSFGGRERAWPRRV